MSAGEISIREGSHAAKVLAFLQKHPQDAFKAAELREACGIPTTGLGAAVKPLVDAGLVLREGKSAASSYRLAEAPPPSDGTLQIAAYSDGDVSILGGTANEDGSVVFTRAQLQQLLAFVTKPLVPHSGPAGATPQGGAST